MKVKKDSSEFANMLALLKEGKGDSFVLTEEDITLGEPQVVPTSVVWDVNDPNKRPLDLETSVLVTAKPASPRYTGSSVYVYRRIDIAKQWSILNGGSYFIRWDEKMIPSFTEEGIKAYIKSRFKYIDSSLTYVFSNYNLDEGSCNVRILPIMNSYVYTGSLLLTFTKNKNATKIPLTTAIPNNNLDGFDYDLTVEIGEPTITGYVYDGRPEG